MKKILKQCLMFLMVVGISCGVVCTHVHTEECGKDGINCTHRCDEEIEVYGETPLNPKI